MNKFFAALAIALAAVQANATSLHPDTFLKRAYTLVQFDLDRNSTLNVGHISYGSIDLDFSRKILRLTVNPSMSCPPGRFCAMVMPAPVVRDLKILHIGTGFCGGRIITAELNQMPVDGIHMHVMVVDETGNRCATGNLRRLPVNVTVTERFPRGPLGGKKVSSTIFGTIAR